MEINNNLIDRLAHLARLQFSPEEKTEIMAGLNEMMGFINKLNELDTSGTPPLLYISDNVNVLRKDESVEGIPIKDVMKNSGFPDSSYFKVPKVISK